MRIGVLSDTHGLLRPEAAAALAGVERIVHAGDVGGTQVLAALQAIAPVTAVRGNTDAGAWADALPRSTLIEAADATLYVLHDIADLDLDPKAAGVDAVVHGHSHRPSVTWREGVLFLNPGSAGPRRFRLPVTLAILETGKPLSARVLDLGGRGRT